MAGTLKLASLSFCSGSDKQKNVQLAVAMIKTAAQNGAEWILLPEIFSFHGPYSQLDENAEVEGADTFTLLSKLAAELGVCIFAGTMGETADPSLGDETLKNSRGERRVHNTMYVFDRQGRLAGKYRKTHLFNLASHESVQSYCEPDGYIPGNERVVIELEGWRVGLSICYDLRFPEFFRAMGQSTPLDMIVLPAAFTFQTGKDHWELLLRARAVENQCYVLASNQCGEHRPGRRSWGHSMIIDPWGHVLSDTGDKPGISYATVSQSEIKAIRDKLPALNNRRPELY